MKILPENKVTSSKLSDIHNLLTGIYGEYKSEFDDKCIEKYEVILSNGIPTEVLFYYDKIKISINGKEGYWPIFTHKEEYNLQAGLALIQGIKN